MSDPEQDAMTGRELLAWLEQQSAELLDRPIYLLHQKRAYAVTKGDLYTILPPPTHGDSHE